jgi:leucyl-tRNA synthetase
MDDTPRHAYDFASIEPKWQKHWLDHKSFNAEENSTKPKFYVLDMFPYPSGNGLHIGHPEGYTGSDILARYKKAKGFNVLHPMGWDAFGLPAEQHAIATGEHPAVQTAKNIANFRRQLRMLGFAIDWDREVNTTDAGYFKWTQWIFRQLFKHNLAYVSEKPVWFCPALGTVLANEEVLTTPEGPRSERGSHPCERRPIRQWVLKITAYAEKLIEGLDELDWPDSTKRLQKNWIGRSEGAEVDFEIDGLPGKSIRIYTTRPDTLFGVSYMVVAPEHPMLDEIVRDSHRAEVDAYVAKARSKSDLERTDLAKDKSGVFTGRYAFNPVNGEKIPVWVADYVLISYGTGAIMAVPAHDERDWEFAKQYGLNINYVIERDDSWILASEDGKYKSDSGITVTGTAYIRPKSANPLYADIAGAPFTSTAGRLINSDKFNGLTPVEAKKAITAELEARGHGKTAVNFKLRDWLFSRQRYWGEPFPILWIDKADLTKLPANSPLRDALPIEPVTCNLEGREVVALPVPERDLPLQLPQVKSYLPSPTGDSPLSHAVEWLHVWLDLNTGDTIPRTGTVAPAVPGLWIRAERETNTMPQWAGSCWYYLRYIDPTNAHALADADKLKYWGCPDFYIGGAEHAVLHLLYARFWHRFLYDIGVLPEPEPFKKLFHQGLIMGEDGEKMSKSRGNVVNPDDIVKGYGADALRMYLMFLGPLEASKPWSTKNIEGIARFLKRTWRVVIDESTGALSSKINDNVAEDPALVRELHKTVKKVTEDIEGLRFNTAISQLMIFLNAWEKAPSFTRATAGTFVQLLNPLAPHIGEELWQKLGNTGLVSSAAWPTYDEAKLVEDTVDIPLQVNGKVRATAVIAKTMPAAEMLALAKAHPDVAKFIEGKEIAKEIVVPGKLVNIAVKG